MRTVVVLVMLLALSACSLPVFFRVPVVQGNVVTAKNVEQLELGMTKRQVEYVMGTALINSSFENDRWDYVFYYRDPRAHVRKSELNLYFLDDRLVEIDGDQEYTEQIMAGETGLDRDNPLPGAVTPGPNNQRGVERDDEGPGPGDNLEPGTGPLSAPLPGT